MYLVIVNRAAHDGYIQKVNMDNSWSNENPHGWTYQQICGSHGQVWCETESESEAKNELAEYLKCDSVETGKYCFTHNPTA